MTKEEKMDMIVDFIDDCICELENKTPRMTEAEKVKEAVSILDKEVIPIIKGDPDLQDLLHSAYVARKYLISFRVDLGNDIKISNLESFKHEIERMKKGKSKE